MVVVVFGNVVANNGAGRLLTDSFPFPFFDHVQVQQRLEQGARKLVDLIDREPNHAHAKEHALEEFQKDMEKLEQDICWNNSWGYFFQYIHGSARVQAAIFVSSQKII